MAGQIKLNHIIIILPVERALFENMKPLLISLLLLNSACTFSEAKDCNDSSTQLEMNTCASTVLTAKQKELNSVISQHRVLLEKNNEASMLNLFDQSNLSWLKYAEDHCESVSSLYQGGSIYNFSLLSCKTTLTKQRIQELKTSYSDTIETLEKGSP